MKQLKFYEMMPKASYFWLWVLVLLSMGNPKLASAQDLVYYAEIGGIKSYTTSNYTSCSLGNQTCGGITWLGSSQPGGIRARVLLPPQGSVTGSFEISKCDGNPFIGSGDFFARQNSVCNSDISGYAPTFVAGQTTISKILNFGAFPSPMSFTLVIPLESYVGTPPPPTPYRVFTGGFTIGAEFANLTVSQTSFTNINASGGSGNFDIASNDYWQITSSATWLTVSQNNGHLNANNITFNASANSTSSSRTATLTITNYRNISRTITITQNAGTSVMLATINVSGIPTSNTVPSTGGTFNATVSNVGSVGQLMNWYTEGRVNGSVSADITFNPASGVNLNGGSSTPVTITIAPNPTSTDRTIRLEFENGDAAPSDPNRFVVYTWTQSGTATPPPTSTLTVNQTSLNFTATNPIDATVSATSNTSWIVSVDGNPSWIGGLNWSGSGNNTFTVELQPNPNTAQRTATLRVRTSDNAVERVITITQEGNTPTPTRIIQITGNFTFPDTPVGQTSTQTITIANSGNAPLTVSGLTFPTAFTGNWGGGTIPAGGSQSVIVTFSPLAAQTYSGTATVNSDATSGLNTFGVSGVGTIPNINCTGCSELKKINIIPYHGATWIATTTFFKWEHELGRGIHHYVLEILDQNDNLVPTMVGTENEITIYPVGASASYKIQTPGWLQNNGIYRWKVTAYSSTNIPIVCMKNEFRVMPLPNEQTGLNGIPFGRALGHYNNVVIYKNDTPADGAYYGPPISTNYTTNPYGWQCVELPSRYYKQVYQVNAGGGNGKDYFDVTGNRTGFKQYHNDNTNPPQAGDIIAFGGTSVGHVAVVKSVTPNPNIYPRVSDYTVWLAQQNVGSNIGSHLNYALKMQYNNGKFWVKNKQISSKYFCRGWVRAEPNILSPGDTASVPLITSNINFSFEEHKNSKGYSIFITKKQANGCYELIPTGVIDIPNNANNIVIPTLDTGIYKWRLMVKLNTGNIYSKAYYFEISNSTNPMVSGNAPVLNPRLNIISIGSELANSKISKKKNGNWELSELTDIKGSMGISNETSIGINDTILISSSGYENIKIILNSSHFQEGKLIVPMIASNTNSSNIIRPNITPIINSFVSNVPNITLKIKAKNATNYSWRNLESNNIEYRSITDSLLTVTLDSLGENYFSFSFYNSLDTVEVSKQIYYLPLSITNTISVSNPQNIRTKVYVNGEYWEDITGNKTFKNLDSVNVFNFTSHGFKNKEYIVDYGEAINLNLELRQQYLSSESQTLNFSTGDKAQSWRSMTFLDPNQKAVIQTKRYQDDWASNQLQPQSETFDMTPQNNETTTLRAKVVFDQPVTPTWDSTYLMIVKGNDVFEKKLVTDNTTFEYEQDFQSIEFKGITLPISQYRFFMTKRLAPLPITQEADFATYRGLAYKFHWNQVFTDPDLLPNDMQVVITDNAGLTTYMEGDSICVKLNNCTIGLYTLALKATHDGLERTNTIKVLFKAPIINFTKTDVSCWGGEDGTIAINIFGNAKPQTVKWNNGMAGDSINTLKANTYTFTSTDANGCTDVFAIVVGQPDSLYLELTPLHITCFGLTDGKSQLKVFGGTAPYTYIWRKLNGTEVIATTQNITALDDEAFEVTVIDAKGCFKKATMLIQEPEQLKVTLKITQPDCPTATNGKVEAIVTGGRPPYRIEHSKGNNRFDFIATDLGATDAVLHQVLVKDANGTCVVTGETTIVPYPQATAQISTQPVCFGDNPEVKVKYNGQVFPYHITLSNGTDTKQFNNITDTTFIYTVNNPVNGSIYQLTKVRYGTDICEADLQNQGEAKIIIWDLPKLSKVNIEAYDCTPRDNQAQIWWTESDVISGQAPFMYSIDGGTNFQPEPKFTGLVNGSYQVLTQDANGCEYLYPNQIVVPKDFAECIFKQVPNFISPNGDGFNDVLEIAPLKYYPQSIVKIMDRGGKVVFESAPGYPTPWDGTYNGQILSFGTYYVYCDLRDGSMPYRGTVSIVR